MLSNNFRLANMNDALSLLEWRNDKLSRKFSFNNKLINMDSHKVWLKSKINNHKSNIYIYKNEKNFSISHMSHISQGMIRLDEIENNQYLISWIIAPKYRNKGIAKKMLSLFMSNFKGELIAKIKNNNLASINIAKYIGMKIKYTKNDICIFNIKIGVK